MAQTKFIKQKYASPALSIRDEAARISASAINAVLEKLMVGHIVEGVGVFPAGAGTYLVDIVMRDLADNSTWSVAITIPPLQEATEKQS